MERMLAWQSGYPASSCSSPSNCVTLGKWLHLSGIWSSPPQLKESERIMHKIPPRSLGLWLPWTKKALQTWSESPRSALQEAETWKGQLMGGLSKNLENMMQEAATVSEDQRESSSPIMEAFHLLIPLGEQTSCSSGRQAAHCFQSLVTIPARWEMMAHA